MQVHLGTNNHSFIQYIKMSSSTLHAEITSPLDLSSQYMYIYNKALILLHYLYNGIQGGQKKLVTSGETLTCQLTLGPLLKNLILLFTSLVHYTHQMCFSCIGMCIINKDSNLYYLET